MDAYSGAVSGMASQYTELLLLGAEPVVEAGKKLNAIIGEVATAIAGHAESDHERGLKECCGLALDEFGLEWSMARRELVGVMRADISLDTVLLSSPL